MEAEEADQSAIASAADPPGEPEQVVATGGEVTISVGGAEDVREAALVTQTEKKPKQFSATELCILDVLGSTGRVPLRFSAYGSKSVGNLDLFLKILEMNKPC